MAKDTDDIKDKTESEDEDLLDFEFDEDFFDKEEIETKNQGSEDEIVDLVDVVEEGHAQESSDEDIEGLDGLLLEEEESIKETPVEDEIDIAEEEILEEGPISEITSGHEDTGDTGTVIMETVPEDMEDELEPILETEEEITLDEELEEEVSGPEAESLEESISPISEETVQAVLTKVGSDIIERVAREVIPEVTERVIREEINALKKSIISED